MKSFKIIIRNKNTFFVAIIAAAMATPLPIMAMNWEGHDDWLSGEHHSLLLKHAGPVALPSNLPTCAAREKARLENVYEQAPLPDINCWAEDQIKLCAVSPCDTIAE